MQLFLRAQNTHTIEVTGQETVGQIKVNILLSFLFGSGMGTSINERYCLHSEGGSSRQYIFLK